jgi:small subunit ribosomal protein S16
VSVKIRLKRLGKIRAPYYRIVVADSRTKRDGRAIEEIGKYHPTEDPSYIEVNSERAQYWLGVGAQPTEQVLAILKVTGDWQTFKGEPGAEGTLRTATPKADKRAVFEAAAKETLGGDAKEATTPARGGGRTKPAKAAEPAKTAEPAETVETAEAAESAEAAAVAEAAAPATTEPAATEQPADAADEGAPGGSETSAQVEAADETAQAEG